MDGSSHVSVKQNAEQSLKSHVRLDEEEEFISIVFE